MWFFFQGPSKKDERCPTCEKNIEVGTNGAWVSDKDDILQFSDCYESGIFSGFNRDNAVFGRNAAGDGPFTAFGFVSVSNENIKGWTGHIYESPTEKRKIDTSWLSHGFSNSCKDPRSLVRYGMDDYIFTYGYKVPEKEKLKVPGWRRVLNYFTSIFP
ncbi:uncharacterized protein NPIL_150571 [Nephila pilipes]|uniref:Uncharacterized protein n=1 Tax=Nephila pilipes TaxID=299642 RepID=A0A8X6T7J7_NEPPI|nr:uncharacterized protein NPIL_150571 [Nephila pilipes]